MAGDRLEGVNGRLASAAIGLAAIVIATVGGSAVFFRSAPLTTLAPLIGVIAALACASLLDAVLVAGVGTLVSAALVAVVSGLRPAGLAAWFGQAALIAAVAVVVAGIVSWMVSSAPRYRPVIAALGVVLVVGSGWLYATSMSSSVQPSTWVTGTPGTAMPFARALVTEPVFTENSADETIYLTLVQKTAAGQGYYAASVATLDQSNSAHPTELVPLDLTFSYRLPTLYWLLSKAPQDGISLVLFALVLQLIATVSAYAMARRFVVAPLALAGAACVGTYFATLATAPSILYTELWAGGFGLLAVTLFIASRACVGRTWGLQAASMLAALTAALFRELGVAFLLVGLAATLTDSECRKARLWALWAGGLAAFAGAYALHARAVFSAVESSGVVVTAVQASSGVPWLRPDGLGLVAAVGLLATALALRLSAAWALYLAGLAGSGVAPRDTASRVVLWAAAFGGSVALMLMRPGGETAAGGPAGYWGMVVIPTVIACVPLVFARIRAARREDPTTLPDRSS